IRARLLPSPLMPNPVERPSRTVRESAHETSALMMPLEENARGHVFGGVVLAMMDKAAAVRASRHGAACAYPASVARVVFREPILVGDLVHMQASVNFVGRTSMEIGI